MQDSIKATGLSDGLPKPNNVFAIATTSVLLPSSFLCRYLGLVSLRRGKDEDQSVYWTRNKGQEFWIRNRIHVLKLEVLDAKFSDQSRKNGWVRFERDEAFAGG
jgi:hypothetical protein